MERGPHGKSRQEGTSENTWRKFLNKTSEQIPRFDFKKTSVIGVLRR